MRRGITALVVVVVAGIALAAGFDALRGDGSPQAGPALEPAASSASTTQPEGPTNYVPLADELGGTLYYTDASCELQAIELPQQTPAGAPNWDECRFVLSPNGRRISGEGSGWDPHSDPLIGKLFQSEDGLIQVSTNRGPASEPFPGRAPAWRSDGTLTYFADGAYREWPEGNVIVSKRVPVQAIGRQWAVPREIRDAAWLDDRRLAVILTSDTASIREEAFALLKDGRLEEALPSLGVRFGRLWASPNGRFVALQTPTLLLFDRAGRTLRVPPIGAIRSLAFSSDDRWAAAATDTGIYVFRPGSDEWTERIDLDAYDLAWRGGAGPPALVDVDDAREWLGDSGTTGRLFVTDGDCRLRALSLPALSWEDEPRASPAPCRFGLTLNEAPIDERVALQAQGVLGAYCEGNDLEVYTVGAGRETIFADACGPAWMPDGRLTFIRAGELYAGDVDGGERLLVSREGLREMFGRPAALEEVTWLDNRRFWAVVRSGGSAIAALLTTDRLVSSPRFTTQTIEGLRVSGSGMVAARTDQGVVFFDTGGRRALTFPHGQAVAWAPGELIAAVATPSEILFVAPVSEEIVTVPLAVRDLEWVVP
jgi:hypothetical protein